MTAREICEAFAKRHRLDFVDKGSCGICRPCVGFKYDMFMCDDGTPYGYWIEYNPTDMMKIEKYYSDKYAGITAEYPYDPYVEGFYSERLEPPEHLDSYHKCNLMCVLVRDDNYEKAIEQLAEWCQYYNEVGVQVINYIGPPCAASYCDPDYYDGKLYKYRSFIEYDEEIGPLNEDGYPILGVFGPKEEGNNDIS